MYNHQIYQFTFSLFSWFLLLFSIIILINASFIFLFDSIQIWWISLSSDEGICLVILCNGIPLVCQWEWACFHHSWSMPCLQTYLSLIPLYLSLHVVDAANAKVQFPAVYDFSGHCLFISAFMLTSKVICDDTYFNKFWSIISQGMFALREINQIERKMCSYLEWQLNVNLSQLQDFESKVWQNFKQPGLYPNYILSSLVSISMPSTTPYTAALSHLPLFVSGCGLSTSLLKPAISDPSLITSLHLKINSYYRHKETAKTCAHFVIHLFACPDLPSPSITNPSTLSFTLAMFIACTLHCTCLHASVIFLC